MNKREGREGGRGGREEAVSDTDKGNNMDLATKVHKPLPFPSLISHYTDT